MISQLASALKYVPIVVTAPVNPTGDPVAVAFTAPGVDPQPADFKAAIWNTSVSPGAGQYMCECLVGPGGTVQLAIGTYAMWVKVTDNPEIPIEPAGSLQIY